MLISEKARLQSFPRFSFSYPRFGKNGAQTMTEQEEYFDDSFEDSFDEDSDSAEFVDYAEDVSSADPLRSHSDTAIAVPSAVTALPALRREIQLPPTFSGANYGINSTSQSNSGEHEDQSAFSR